MSHHGTGVSGGSVECVGSGVLNDRDSALPSLTHGSPSHNAAVAALQHQRALNYSTLAAAAAVANGAAGPNGPVTVPVSGGGAGPMTPSEALLSAGDASSAAAALAVGTITLGPLAMDPGVPSSTETLLRNIQSLLKVAADNARQQERQITYEKGKSEILLCQYFTYTISTLLWYFLKTFKKKKLFFSMFSLLLYLAELKMDVLREREVKDSLERQLVDERKLRGKCTTFRYNFWKQYRISKSEK